MIGLTTDHQLLLTNSAFIISVPSLWQLVHERLIRDTQHWNNMALSCTELFGTLTLITTINPSLSYLEELERTRAFLCLMLHEADSKVSGFHSLRLKCRNIKTFKRNDHSMCRYIYICVCVYPGTHFC